VGSLYTQVADAIVAQIDPLTTAAFTRLYRDPSQSPGAEPLTRASALAALDQGPDLAFLFGFGGPGSFALDTDPNPETLEAEDFLALQNQRSQGHAVALSAFVTVPGQLSVGAALIRADHGGCVSVLGPTDIELIAVSSAYLQTYLKKGFADHVPTIGEAMRAALRDPPFPPTFNAQRLTTLGNTLLGDPALSFPAGVAPAAAQARAARSGPATPGADAAAGRAAVTPNPARAETEITFETSTPGAPLDVAVLDVAGRRVRTLENGEAPTGKRKLAWDLRDDQGRRVPSGLYFVKLTQGTRSKFTRVVVQ
jgi:hypothetical protein